MTIEQQKTNVPSSELWNIQEVIAYLRVGRGTIYRLMDKGELKAYRIGQAVRFYPEDVRACMKPRKEALQSYPNRKRPNNGAAMLKKRGAKNSGMAQL